MTQNWSSADVTSNGIKLHYYRTGSGDKPPLILCHGATDSGLCWTRVTRVLEQDYDVIMPDARGHGLSDAPPTGYSSDDHARDIKGLIEALNLDKPAVGGHSMGAATTLRLIADYPDLTSCAILEDPPIWSAGPPTSAPGRPSPREAIRRTVIEAQSSDIATVIARGKTQHPSWSDEEWQPWAEAKQHVSEHFLDEMATVPPAANWRELLARTTTPTLLVTSDPERGGIVTPEAAAEAQQILPTLRVIRLEGAGHNIRREQFDPFVAASQSFLATYVGGATLTHT